MLQTEQWRAVPGFDGLYEISDLGRVRSVARRRGARTGRILRPGRVGQGKYFQVHLFDGTRNRRMIHRLVLEAFTGPCPHGMEGCHHDDDPGNNRLDNLFWGSHLDNCSKFIGEGNPMSASNRQLRADAR